MRRFVMWLVVGAVALSFAVGCAKPAEKKAEPAKKATTAAPATK